MPTLNSPTLSGDVSGTIYSVNVNKIRGVNVASTSPLSNQTLVYDGTQWAPSSSLSGTTANFSVSLSAATAAFTGNVGIGTATPTSAHGNATKILHVSSTDNNIFNFTNSTIARGGIIEFNRTGRSVTPRFAQIQGATDASDHGYLAFYTAVPGSDAGTNERIRIDSQGDLGIGTATPNEKLTVAGNISATGFLYGDGTNLTGIAGGSARLALSGGTMTGGLSAPALSGTFFGDGSRLTGIAGGSARLALSGGTLTGDLTGTNASFSGNFGLGTTSPVTKMHVVGNSRLQGDLTITGNLSCAGTQTFTNTVFTTTSAVSVVNFGSGAALYVGNNGPGDIASFYDIDQNIEILHVGGNNGTFPNVGVKTSSPNKTLTVAGEISASGDIWTTTNFNGARATFSTSISAPALSGAFFGDGSRLTGIGGGTSNALPLSGGTMTGPLNLVTTTETKATPSIASSALSLDLATATLFSVTVNSNVTFTFANTPASPRVYSFMLQLIGDGTVRSITWPTAVRWGGGVVPTPTSTASKVDTYSFLTHDGGTNWFGFVVEQNS
jgi:hypothetical protein